MSDNIEMGIEAIVIEASLLIFSILMTIYIMCNPFARRLLQQFYYIAIERLWLMLGIKDIKMIYDEQDITVEWLSLALHEYQAGTHVKDVKKQVMGDDMGNASLMFRLKLSYHKNPHRLPDTMILKVPKKSFSNRLIFAASKLNEMEPRFYMNIGHDTSIKFPDGIHFPKTYAGRYEERGGNFYVLMEDIVAGQKAKFMNEFEEIKKFDEAAEIVRGIARFHAPFFANSILEERKPFIIHQQDPIMCMTAPFMKAGHKRFIQRLGDKIPKEIVDNCLALYPIAQNVHDFLGNEPTTLVHGDCHNENSYFVPSQHNDVGFELGLYDFQLMRRAKGSIDLASYIGGSISPDLLTKDNNEDKLLQIYLEELASFAGDENGNLYYIDKNFTGLEKLYDFDALKSDYKMSLALLLVWNIAAALAVPFNTSAQHHYDAYANRLCQSVHRNSAINYALYTVGAKEVAIAETRFDYLASRHEIPQWTVPPVHHVVLPDESKIDQVASHLKHGIKLHVTVHTKPPTTIFGKIVYNIKFRIMYLLTSSRSGYHGQKVTDIPFDTLEHAHPVDFLKGTEFENDAIDSYYLSMFPVAKCEDERSNEKNNCWASLRWCRRIDPTLGEVWLILIVPNKGVFTWVDHPTTQCTAVSPSSNVIYIETPKGHKYPSKMIYTCDEPMEKWSVDFDGYLKHQQTGTIVKTTFQIKYNQCMPFFAFGTNVDPKLTSETLALEHLSKGFFDELRASHQEHYEQFGYSNGSIEFHDTKFQGTHDIVNACGMRDRAFGLRNWGYLSRYIAHYFVTESKKFMAANFAALPTLTNFRGGYVYFPDKNETCSLSDLSGKFSEISPDGIPPQELELAFVSNGVTFGMRCIVENTVGLNMGPNGMWINLRFCKYVVTWTDPKSMEIKTEVGYGCSEFGYRVEGAKFNRPKKIVNPTQAQGH